MAELVAGDRVKETSISTGTGDLTLAGAVTGFQAVSAIPGISDTDILILCIAHQSANEWETAVCRWNSGAGSITRLTTLESTNSDAAVNFSAGTKDIFCVLPAQSGSPLVNRRPQGNVYVPDFQSLYFPFNYELQANNQIEVAADGVVEAG